MYIVDRLTLDEDCPDPKGKDCVLLCPEFFIRISCSVIRIFCSVVWISSFSIPEKVSTLLLVVTIKQPDPVLH